MLKHINNKDSKIKELFKSIQEINITIHAFATAQTLRTLAQAGGQGGRTGGGRGGSSKFKFTVKYCWTCGVQTSHHG
eukprot:12171664-Ditylum_brightwellii.AAC.1